MYEILHNPLGPAPDRTLPATYVMPTMQISSCYVYELAESRILPVRRAYPLAEWGLAVPQSYATGFLM